MPNSVGWGASGPTNGESAKGYTQRDGGYDDCIMRIAQSMVNPDHYQLTWLGAKTKCNCQRFQMERMEAPSSHPPVPFGMLTWLSSGLGTVCRQSSALRTSLRSLLTRHGTPGTAPRSRAIPPTSGISASASPRPPVSESPQNRSYARLLRLPWPTQPGSSSSVRPTAARERPWRTPARARRRSA